MEQDVRLAIRRAGDEVICDCRVLELGGQPVGVHVDKLVLPESPLPTHAHSAHPATIRWIAELAATL